MNEWISVPPPTVCFTSEWLFAAARLPLRTTDTSERDAAISFLTTAPETIEM